MAKNDKSYDLENDTSGGMPIAGPTEPAGGKLDMPAREYGHEREMALEGRVKALEDASDKAPSGDFEARLAFIEKHLGITAGSAGS